MEVRCVCPPVARPTPSLAALDGGVVLKVDAAGATTVTSAGPQTNLQPSQLPTEPPGAISKLLQQLSVGFTATFYQQPKVTSAFVDSANIVRVDNSRQFDVRIFLSGVAIDPIRHQGPFGGVVLNDALSIDGLGAGYAWSFSALGPESTPSLENLYLGIGIMLDMGYTRLPSGYVDGQPAPAGAPQGNIKLKTESTGSPFLLVGYRFGSA